MPKQVRKPRSQEVLRTVSNRLFYEWQVLTSLAQALTTGNQMLKNAFIESCAIHARALVKFLYAYRGKNEPRIDDAIAEDYFSSPDEWQNNQPAIPRTLCYKSFGIFADKQIAHIVYTNEKNESIIGQKKNWDFTEVADSIQPALEKFVSMIQKEQLGDRWLTLLENQTGPRWDELKRQVSNKNI
jgi:hypothetical protein